MKQIKNHLWTKKEIEILNKYYPSASMEKLMKLLPKRAFQAIQRKAQRLGLKRRYHFNKTHYSSLRVKGREAEKLAVKILKSLGFTRIKLHALPSRYYRRHYSFMGTKWYRSFNGVYDALALPFDIIAYKRGQLYYVEVKSTTRERTQQIYLDTVQNLVEMADRDKAIPVILTITPRGYRFIDAKVLLSRSIRGMHVKKKRYPREKWWSR